MRVVFWRLCYHLLITPKRKKRERKKKKRQRCVWRVCIEGVAK